MDIVHGRTGIGEAETASTTGFAFGAPIRRSSKPAPTPARSPAPAAKTAAATPTPVRSVEQIKAPAPSTQIVPASPTAGGYSKTPAAAATAAVAVPVRSPSKTQVEVTQPQPAPRGISPMPTGKVVQAADRFRSTRGKSAAAAVAREKAEQASAIAERTRMQHREQQKKVDTLRERLAQKKTDDDEKARILDELRRTQESMERAQAQADAAGQTAAAAKTEAEKAENSLPAGGSGSTDIVPWTAGGGGGGGGATVAADDTVAAEEKSEGKADQSGSPWTLLLVLGGAAVAIYALTRRSALSQAPLVAEMDDEDEE